jgi:hypothetical protein
VFFVLGVVDRLRDLLEDKRWSKLLRLPVVEDPSTRTDKTVRNLYDSEGWWRHVVQGRGRVDGPETHFGRDADGQPTRNIVLSLNIDGFAPFTMKHNSLSMTPMVYQVLNLPENLRHRAGFLILAALHPGPSAIENHSLYLQVLVDELVRLWVDGINFADPERDGEMCNVKVKLLFTSADYPAHCKNNCQQGAGSYNGCIKCHLHVSVQHTGDRAEQRGYCTLTHPTRLCTFV